MSQKWLTSGANRLREKKKLKRRADSIAAVKPNCEYRFTTFNGPSLPLTRRTVQGTITSSTKAKTLDPPLRLRSSTSSLKMNGLPSDALSRLAAVAGDTFYSRRISAEDETDRQDVTALSTQHYSLPQFRDSAPGGDLSGSRVVKEETLAIPTHPSDTGNTSRFPPAPLGLNDLQLIEVERRKLLAYEDELILQDHIIAHEKILLQKKIEESSLFAIRQMRLFTKDELTSRFYDIEKIICKQDMAQRYRESGKQQLNPNDVSGLRSVLHRILIEETMPLSWSESRFTSNRDLNTFSFSSPAFDAVNRNGPNAASQVQVLEHLKDSSLWNGRATSSLVPPKFSPDHYNASHAAAASASTAATERPPFDSILQEMPRKRSFQEDFELQSGKNHGSVPDPLAYHNKKPRPEIPNDLPTGNGSHNDNNHGRST